MTSTARRASALLAPMRRLEASAVEPDDFALAREERTVAAILVAASSRPTRGRRGWVIATGTLLPVAACIALYLGRTPHGAPTRPSSEAHWVAIEGRVTVFGSGGQEWTARTDQTLRGAERLVVPEKSTATIELPSGAAARLGEGTELALGTSGAAQGEERLNLSRGRVSLVVPRLANGRSLSVVTPQAMVSVVGTRFAVSVMCPPGRTDSRTCVSVDEGKVRVRGRASAHLLGPGEHWSSDGGVCAVPKPEKAAALPGSPGSTASAPTSTVATAGPRTRPGQSTRHDTLDASRVPQTAPPAPPESIPSAPGSAPATAAFGVSTLDQQVQLFGAAMQARRNGDRPRAVELLERLLNEHPASPLAIQARRELDRIRRESGQ